MDKKIPQQIQTQKQKKPEFPCDECDKILHSKQALISHQHYKHPTFPTTQPAALPAEDPKEAERASLLAEIEELKKQMPQAPVLTNPEPEPAEPKPRLPWLVKDAKPPTRAKVQDLPQTDKKQQEGFMKIFKNAKSDRNAIEYGETISKTIEYKAGSWMDVYKEDLLVRTIPFIWQQDKETKQNWAICLEQQFYGRKMGNFQLNYNLLIVPFNKSRKYVDYYGKGFKIGVDEISQLQIPIHELDSDDKLHARLEDNAYNSQNMALYRELIIHAKKKWNWTLILIIVLVLVGLGVAAYYIYTHPSFLKGLTTLAIMLR